MYTENKKKKETENVNKLTMTLKITCWTEQYWQFNKKETSNVPG